MKPFYIYMLRCADGSYYCGQTDNIESRMGQHDSGEIGYTSTRKPVQLIWQGEFETREAAISFEQQIKGWSRAKKEALIAGDWEKIQQLAKSKNNLNQVADLQVRDSKISVRAELVEASASPSTSSVGMQTTSVRPEVSKGVAMPFDTSGRTEGVARIELILQCNRRAIAKAITLLESTRADHRVQADEMLAELMPYTGKSFRLGISGVPGVGKSTFIEALGLYLIEQGHRVAVLAVDPSSSVSGGSILGDKTRMEQLSVHEKAFIRPSPASGNLGGVASHTREAMLVCEAAGYDIVIVETVGVGQSEIAVAGMTDMFVLMQLPNAGDDLQAIKKGVMELADLVVINKADIDPDAAMRAQAQIVSSMRIFEMHGHEHQASYAMQRVLQLSALKGTGLPEFWQAVCAFQKHQHKSGQMQQRRQQQAVSWMWERIESGLKAQFRSNPQVQSQLPLLTQQVLAGEIAASTAARKLLNLRLAGKNTA
jgi:LAO/AO transport system kinase